MRAKRFLLLSAVALLVIFTLSSTSFAETGNEKSVKLRPSQDSTFVFDSVELLVYSNEEVRCKVKGSGKVGDEPIEVSIDIDPDNKTYKATKLPLSIVAPNIATDTVSDATSDIQQYSKKSSDSRTVYAASTVYSKKVGIKTQDPINITCCSSWLGLTWTVESGVVVNYTRSKGQWDGQPTLALTYWYLDYHNYGGSSLNTTCAWDQSSAQHHNDDFGDNSLRTWAYHSMILYGYYNGTYSYEAEWAHSGESSDLLHAHVYFP